MEIWQHLLILLIGGSGLLWGAIIALYTRNEILYAEKYMIFFNQLSGLLLVCLALWAEEFPWWAYTLVLALFVIYIYKKSTSKKMQSLKHEKRCVMNYITYAIYGLLYGEVSTSSLVMLFSIIIFINSLAIGSLAHVRKKDSLEYVLPYALYVAVGLIWTLAEPTIRLTFGI